MSIGDILAAAGFICTKPPYKGPERTFVTYQYMGQTGTLYAEGREQETNSVFSVDLYTENDVCDYIPQIKNALITGGYSCIVEAEIYEDDTRLTHIPMTAVTRGAVYG